MNNVESRSRQQLPLSERQTSSLYPIGVFLIHNFAELPSGYRSAVLQGFGQRLTEVEEVVELEHQIRVQKAANRILSETNRIDYKTGLLNDRGYAERLQAEIEDVRRRNYDTGRTDGGDEIEQGFVILRSDIDDLRGLNKAIGHDLADQVLAETAQRLMAKFRPSDFGARVGGDEMVLCLNGVNLNEMQGLVRKLHAMHKSLKAPIAVKGCEVEISTSMGAIIMRPEDVARAADSPEFLEQVKADADRLQIRAKNDGKDRLYLQVVGSNEIITSPEPSLIDPV